MRFAQIAASQPALGEAVAEALIRPGVLLAGTIRRDGSARISGVEPLVAGGELWLSMLPSSAKAHDLRADPRVELHSIVTGRAPGAEVKLRGTVREAAGRPAQERYAAAAAAELGWQPVPGQFALFAVDVRDVTYIGHDPDTGAQHVARWPGGGEYLRPVLTPTSLGPRQPVRRLLI